MRIQPALVMNFHRVVGDCSEVTPGFMEEARNQVVLKVCHHDGGHGKLMGQVSISFKKLVDGTNYLAVHAPISKTLVGQVRSTRDTPSGLANGIVCLAAAN